MPNCKFDNPTPNDVRLTEELEALAEIARILSSRSTQEEILHKISDALNAACGTQRVTILLVGENNSASRAPAMVKALPPRGESLERQVCAQGEPAIVESSPGEGPSFVCAPIRVDERTVGAMTLECDTHAPQALQEYCRLLSIVAMMLAGSPVTTRSPNLPKTAETTDPPNAPSNPYALRERIALLEHELVIAALKRNKGVVSAAARELGITERMVRYKIEKLAIDYEALFKRRRGRRRKRSAA